MLFRLSRDLLWGDMPLLKRGSGRVGKRALEIGMHIADEFTSGQNIKLVAK